MVMYSYKESMKNFFSRLDLLERSDSDTLPKGEVISLLRQLADTLDDEVRDISETLDDMQENK